MVELPKYLMFWRIMPDLYFDVFEGDGGVDGWWCLIIFI